MVIKRLVKGLAGIVLAAWTLSWLPGQGQAGQGSLPSGRLTDLQVQVIQQQVDLSKISPVVQVATFNGTSFLKAGSGTIIHPSGLILTNFHVISDTQMGCENVQGTPGSLFVILVTEHDKENEPPVPKFTAIRIPEAEDPAHDLAILKLNQGITGVKDLEELKRVIAQLPTTSLPPGLKLPTLGLWDSSVLQEGSRLVAQGYPDASEAGLPRLTISRGPVFTLEPRVQPKFLFIENLFTIPGISGGPVIDADSGLIVGVMCGSKVPKEKPAQEPLEQAVLINFVQPLLQKAPQRVNRMPVAEFTWTPLNPKIGEMVTFNAVGSRDPDGSIVKYEWDFNSDGTPDQSGQQVTFTVPSEEDVSVTLVVTDNESGSHSRSKRVVLLRQATCVARIGERQFPSIQAAIDAAQPGEAISVSEGQCQENLIIQGKQNLMLKGAGAEKTTLLGLGLTSVIKIKGSQQITVEGFTVRDGLVGVQVLNSFGVILRENAIKQNLGRGVELIDVMGPSLETVAVELVQNWLEGNGDEGLVVRGSAVEVRSNVIRRNQQGGILIRDTVREGQFLKVVLRDTILEGNWIVGVAIAWGSRADIVGGRITKTQRERGEFGEFGVGLEIDSGFNAATIQEVTIAENQGGGVIVKGASRQVRFIQTTISSNKARGLIIQGSARGTTITNSQIIKNSSEGILLEDSAGEITVRQSAIAENLTGIFITDRAQIKEITESEVRGNTTGIFIGREGEATIKGNTIQNNKGCGIRAFSEKPPQGRDNRFGGNQIGDLCGNIPSALRSPLLLETEAEIRFPNPRYPTLQHAVDALKHGGTLVIAAGTHKITGLTIYKDLTLRGAGRSQTTLEGGLSICCEALQVRLEGLTIQKSPREALVLFANGMLQAILAGVQLSDNGAVGLTIGGATQATLSNVRISDNKTIGILMRDTAHATLENVEISKNNAYGLSLIDSAQAILQNSRIFSNGATGLVLWDKAQAIVQKTTISDNGTRGTCRLPGADSVFNICSGILVVGRAELNVHDSQIGGNTDWGVTAWLRKCGYREDDFTGRVILAGQNTITSNNKSGNHTGQGNPEGQICLP